MEFKVLLDPSRFVDAEEGLDKFYGQLEKAADQVGLEAEHGDDLECKRRTLEYLDTADFALRERGYILRSRTEDKARPTLALKFRDADRARVAAADVAAKEELASESKFEKDVTPSKELFASSTKVRLKKLPGERLEDYAEVFPGLEDLGLSPRVRLQPVQGREIAEEVHALAEVHLASGVESEALVSLWYEDDRPVIAEFSFGIPGQEPKAEADAQALLRSVQEQAGDWIATGTTKTEYVYSAK